MPENGVRAVQMPRRRQSDEKLAAVSVGTGIRHAQNTCGRVRELGHDFVGEFAAVDGGAASAAASWVAGLDHEVADDAVAGDGVVEACCGEGGEVVACLLEDLLDGFLGGGGLNGHGKEFFSIIFISGIYLWSLFPEEANSNVAHGRVD